MTHEEMKDTLYHLYNYKAFLEEGYIENEGDPILLDYTSHVVDTISDLLHIYLAGV